jgi:uncharacterized protein YfdQ (DUF2303 family)
VWSRKQESWRRESLTIRRRQEGTCRDRDFTGKKSRKDTVGMKRNRKMEKEECRSRV